MAKAKRAMRKQQGYWQAKASLGPAPWDHGAAGQANRIGLVVEERGEKDPRTGKVTNPNRVTGARRVDMLEIYHRRGVLSARAYSAGEMLRLAWLATEKGQCAPWLRERVDSSPKPDAAIGIQIDRMSALMRVTKMVPSRDRDILDCVCAQGVGVAVLPCYRGPRHPRGLEHLSAALEGLADRLERG